MEFDDPRGHELKAVPDALEALSRQFCYFTTIVLTQTLWMCKYATR